MTTLYESAYAKINLTLDVLGKRPDGFHELETVMQSLSLRDEIQLDVGTGAEWSLSCEKTGVPCDRRNLAWKAALAFEQALGKTLGGLAIRMEKQIPSEAGMGGGSSDAAAVLRALNRHFGQPFSPMELAAIGAEVGSDVPFCVVGGTCMCTGRGETLRSLPPLPDCEILICKPDFGVSTPALYRAIDETEICRRPDQTAMEQALSRGALGEIGSQVCNVFDPLVSARHPEIRQIRSVMDACGAMASQMTGSGSAVFALMPDAQSVERAFRQLSEEFAVVYRCRPV